MNARLPALTMLFLTTVGSVGSIDQGLERYCKNSGPGFQWFSSSHTSEGYEIAAPTYSKIARTWGESLQYKGALSRGELPAYENYCNVTESLAISARAIVIFVGEAPAESCMTAAPVPLGKTWRGTTPLECLRAFAKDAGLKVAVPEEGLWVVGPKDDVDTTAVVVTAYPFDTGQALLGGDTLRAVLRTLPVRNWGSYVDADLGQPQAVSLALGYYRIPEEDGRYIFVVSNSFAGGDGAVTGVGPGGMTFKVEIEAEGLDAVVRCIWGTPGVGELVPGFAEDLDGDGYRDYLLLEEERGALKPLPGEYNFVLSGKDGRGLVSYYHSGELAVEKRTDGPKKIAVQGLYRPGGEGLDRTDVLIYDEKEGRFVPAPRETPDAQAEAAEQTKVRTTPAKALAAMVGGPEHVVIYDVSTREPVPSSWERIAELRKTGTIAPVQLSLWHLCAWNRGPGEVWRRIFEEGLPAPAEVLVQYIPEGYKRAYLDYLEALAPPGYPIILPSELQPRRLQGE